MAGWLQALKRTRENFLGSVTRLFRRTERPDAQTLEEWEDSLLRAGLPVRLVGEWVDSVRNGAAVDVAGSLRTRLLQSFAGHRADGWTHHSRPTVVLLVGVNGSGKTTTAAKVAWQASRQGLKPLLAACDTFRAAGSDQLRIWADRVGCEVVAGQTGADASAVAYDAVEAAVSRKADVLIIDTAGRMHTRQPLMDELRKVTRSVGKALEGAPHETWMVLDASLGQNAVVQARQFAECVPLTGAVVTKLDGSSKGGFVPSLYRDLKLPVLFAGLGEGMEDLAPFDPEAYVDSLIGPADTGA